MACGELTEQPSDEKYINVESTSKSLESAKGNFKIVVESNTEWSVTTSAEWLTILGSTEYAGTCEVAFSYGENTSTKSRNAKVEIEPMVAGEASPYTILVSQKAASNTGGGNTGGNDNTGGNTGGDDDNTGDNGGNDNTGGNGGGVTTNGYTPHTGWAELPAEENNSDYYYAYHMIPDKGNGKVRNFAVCYSKELGCPVWVASPMHSYYTTKNTSRSDAYGPDPVIPASIQVHKREGYTRGHMLGSSDRLVSVGANKQAFYYSNIAPQLSSGFNTGGGVWNNLEEYCDGLLCADTLYMVNGCYWENYNKKSSGTVIPTHYYKVLLRTKNGNSGKWVVNCSASELKCVVFMVEHNSNQHKVEPHRGMMMSVAELERMTGHTFFPNVPNAPKDTFSASDWGL